MLRQLTADLARTGRRAALGLGASVLLVVGIGFLTAALWMSLALAGGALYATGLIGCAYLGLGLIGMVLAGRSPVRPAPPAEPAPVATADTLVQAFLGGLHAGARARRKDG